MLKVCSDYATEFSISFNPKKTKCMFFRPIGKPISVNPLLYINESTIEYVTEWQHLGNIIETSQLDSACIINRRNKAIGQINDVLCYFGKYDSITETKLGLLYAYSRVSSSFHGTVLYGISNEPKYSEYVPRGV
jgi:hypothetical protein